MNISIRKFKKSDIPYKIKWINEAENNRFMHYDLPLEYNKTVDWFHRNKGRKDRYDAIIEADKTPVGLIGLLSIDRFNQKAEYYIVVGEAGFKGKGVAKKASLLI